MVRGAAWNLTLGTTGDRVDLGVAGAPAAGETWSVTLVHRSWTSVHTHLVSAGQTLADVLAALETSIDAAGFSASHSAVSTATTSSGMLTVKRLGAFELRFAITPAAGQANEVDTTTGTTLSTDEYRYVAGANRDVLAPDSLDVTVVDNDAPGVLILQSGDSTDVIEPTEIVVLGSGFLSQKTSVRFKLEGTGVAGQTWTVFLTEANTTSGPPPSTSYSFVVPAGGASLSAIAASLAHLINTTVDSFTFTASSSGEYLTISNPAPFNMYLKAGTDRVIFIGDFGTAITREVGIHDSVFNAQDLDAAKWNKNANLNIADSNTIPHLTVLASGDGNADFYAFEVTEEMLEAELARGTAFAGVRVSFDIDNGYRLGDSTVWASLLRLWELKDPLDPNAPRLPNLLATGILRFADAGSSAIIFGFSYDGFLTFNVLEKGTYFIEVSAFGLDGVPQGADYELHASIEQHAVNTFLFAPQPLAEQEGTNNLFPHGQDLDGPVDGSDTTRGLNFFTFFDPAVGNLQMVAPGGLVIDSTTPYARIIGNGDFSPDIFSFDITPSPTAIPAASISSASIFSTTNTTNSLLDGSTYYSSVTLKLTGKVKAGDVWQLGIGYRDYATAPALSTTTLWDIATALAGQIDDLAGYSVEVTPAAEGDGSSAFLTITNTASGLTLQGRHDTTNPDGLVHNVDNAGAVKRTTTAKDDTGNAIDFSAATVTLAGSVAVGDKWVVTVGLTPYTYVVATGDTLSTLDDRLQALVNGTPYSPDLDSAFEVVRGSSFTLAISVEGPNPQASASIAGRPAGQPVAGALPAQVRDIDWTVVSVDLGGTAHQNERWTLTVAGVEKFRDVTLLDTPATIADFFRTQFAGSSAFTVAGSGEVIDFTFTSSGQVEFSISQAETEGTLTAEAVAAMAVLGLGSLSGINSLVDDWTLELDDVADYVQAALGTRDATAAALVAQINADTSTTGYSAQYDSITNVLVIRHATDSFTARLTEG